VKAALVAAESLEANHDQALEQWRLQVERARYEAQRAERRYRQVEPEHLREMHDRADAAKLHVANGNAARPTAKRSATSNATSRAGSTTSWPTRTASRQRPA